MIVRRGRPKLPPAVTGEYVHPEIAQRVYECLTTEAWSEERSEFIPTSWPVSALQGHIPGHAARIVLALKQIPGVITRLHRSGETLYKLETANDRRWRGESNSSMLSRGMNVTIHPARLTI